jgi:hypothetical protein
MHPCVPVASKRDIPHLNTINISHDSVAYIRSIFDTSVHTIGTTCFWGAIRNELSLLRWRCGRRTRDGTGAFCRPILFPAQPKQLAGSGHFRRLFESEAGYRSSIRVELRFKSNIANTVIETESFMKQAAALWSSAELDDLKDYSARNPPCRR